MRPFEDRVVVIAGAGSTLDYAIAERFAVEGARLVIAHNNAAPEKGSATSLGATVVPLDMARSASIQGGVQSIVKLHGRIDVWINSVPTAHQGLGLTLEPQHWDADINVKLSGAFYCSRYAGQVMLDQGRGNLVNIVTCNGLFAQKRHASSCAAEAGLIMLTKVLAAEWAERGVRVNTVARGIIMTDAIHRAIDQGLVTQQAYLSRIPMGRFGELNEIAEAVMFLAGDEASYVTGECLRVDGGWSTYHLFYPFEDAFENWNG